MAQLVFLAIVVAAVAGAYYYLSADTRLPKVKLDEWWGPESLKMKADNSIRPFRIQFEENMITDLENRLKNTRHPPPPLEGVNFEYGFNSKQLGKWLSYWSEKYDFAEREKYFNKYQHFKTNIQGLDIHFIRVTPEVPKGKAIVPLLILHGWPGSVREFYETIPFLTAVAEDREFAVEVIAPSLPGFGWSDAAVRPGLGAAEAGVILRNLMHRLGHQRYYIQGGDWGAIITQQIAALFPEEILGYHTNWATAPTHTAIPLELLGSIMPTLVVAPELAERMYPLKKYWAFYLEETGYLHMQASKPDTLGIPLSDSPAGLLAYFLEKFSTATDPANRARADGGLYDTFSQDQLIDNLMVYWSTNSITSSFRLYAEGFGRRFDMSAPILVPSWALQARYEITYQPPAILRLRYRALVNTTVLPDGGHFIALEQPAVFAADVLRALTAFRNVTDANKNK